MNIINGGAHADNNLKIQAALTTTEMGIGNTVTTGELIFQVVF